MWRLVSEFFSSEVSSLHARGKKIFFISDREQLVAYDKGIFYPIEKHSVHLIEECGSRLYFQSSGDLLRLYYLEGLALSQIYSSEGVGIRVVNENRAIVTRERTQGNSGFLQGHDLSSARVLWELERVKASKLCVIGGHFFILSEKDSRLQCLNPDTGETFWQYKLPEGQKFIHNTFKVQLGLILGEISSGKRKTSIFGINVEAGTLHWRIKTHATSTLIHPKTGLLHSLVSRWEASLGKHVGYYDVIDPFTGKFLQSSFFTKQLRETGLDGPRIYEAVITEDSIYFPSQKFEEGLEFTPWAIARFDLTTQRIVSYHVLEGKNNEPVTHVSDLVFHQGRLFVLINHQRLCVFEEN